MDDYKLISLLCVLLPMVMMYVLGLYDHLSSPKWYAFLTRRSDVTEMPDKASNALAMVCVTQAFGLLTAARAMLPMREWNRRVDPSDVGIGCCIPYFYSFLVFYTCFNATQWLALHALSFQPGMVPLKWVWAVFFINLVLCHIPL